jgi:two-component system, OmpR family, phosphate regulon sensor histidine kinase PhoR
MDVRWGVPADLVATRSDPRSAWSRRGSEPWVHALARPSRRVRAIVAGLGRFTPPAAVQLRRAQLTLMLAALVPTVFMIALGIVLLALGRGTAPVVIGVLVLAFCSTSLTGYILGTIFVSRGEQVARFQHDFLSLVSHEMRTPLTSILMFLDTLRDERLTDPTEKRQCLELLDQEVRRLDQLLERLLQLSRLQSRRQRFDRAPVQIADVVRDALAAFDAATLTSKVEVSVDLESARDLQVRGDRDALSQAVSNLLVNAWKYTPADCRRIELHARATDRHVELAVSDNGPGIARDEQKRIFGQFERGDAGEKSGQRGSGLGLAIVRAVVRAHHGRLDLRSRPGQGAEFRIRLPRTRAASSTSGA